MASRRMERVARLVQAEVSRVILFELRDPRMSFVTVTKVEMSPDLRSGRVFVSILGGEAEVRAGFNMLQHARGHIQHLIGERLPLRYTPVLQFRFDPSVRKSVELSKLISDVLSESKPSDPSEVVEDADGRTEKQESDDLPE